MTEYLQHCPKLPWMVDFYATGVKTVLQNQLKAAFTKTDLEHSCNLDVHSKAAKHKCTQLVYTLAPGVTVKTIENLLVRDMNVARIRLVDVAREKCAEVISKLRHITDTYSRKVGRLYPLAIMLEFRGTEMRTGRLRTTDHDKIYLEEGQDLKLTTDPSFENLVTHELIYVDYQRISKLVKPGDKILLDNGKIALSTIETAENAVRCVVQRAGFLSNNAEVSVINAPIEECNSLNELDKTVKFALVQQVDAIILTTIINDKNIRTVKEKIKAEGRSTLVFAAIENIQAIENIDSIIKASDGIIVGNLRLLTELAKPKIFLIQKMICGKCNAAGKPVFCGFEIEDTSTLSKAEICDLATAVNDGADALILLQNVYENRQFFQTLSLVNSVCREAEAAIHQRRVFMELADAFSFSSEAIYSLAISVVESSYKCNAAAIIVLSHSGRSAKVISRFRPRCPIISVTRDENVGKQLQFFRGIIPIIFISKLKGSWQSEVDQRVQLGITWGKVNGNIKMGDSLVIVAGARRSSGFTNSMKIVFASEYDVMDEPEEDNCDCP